MQGQSSNPEHPTRLLDKKKEIIIIYTIFKYTRGGEGSFSYTRGKYYPRHRGGCRPISNEPSSV